MLSEIYIYVSGNILRRRHQVSHDDDFVYIYTKHFTKFIVTNTDTVQEITDALFTVAASYEQTDVKSIIQLRLMLHSDCASLKDFSFQRRKVGGINC